MNRYRIKTIYTGVYTRYMPQKRFLFIWWDLSDYPTVHKSIAQILIDRDIKEHFHEE